MEERLGYFATKNTPKYIECIRSASEENEATLMEASMDALKYLGITEEIYKASLIDA